MKRFFRVAEAFIMSVIVMATIVLIVKTILDAIIN